MRCLFAPYLFVRLVLTASTKTRGHGSDSDVVSTYVVTYFMYQF